ncbi:MAG: hypothetical protein KJN60_09000 [Boseongicola sp.]|nr:hypothetical protein [Boseongicola sp.]
MWAGLRQAVHLERRRLYFVTLLAFVAGVLFYARLDMVLFGLPAPFIVGLIYAFIIGFAALIVCILAPSFRFMLEAIAISRLAVAGVAFSFPALGDTILASPILNAIIVVGFGVAVSRLMHGRIVRPARVSLENRLLAYAEEGRGRIRVTGNVWQRNYVAWMDDAVAVAA